jgi:hypothetical protein
MATKRKAAQTGKDAVMVGSPDYGHNGDDLEGILTDAGDAITNILHWIESEGADPDEAIRKAQMHFDAERVGGDEELETEE